MLTSCRESALLGAPFPIDLYVYKNWNLRYLLHEYTVHIYPKYLLLNIDLIYIFINAATFLTMAQRARVDHKASACIKNFNEEFRYMKIILLINSANPYL